MRWHGFVIPTTRMFIVGDGWRYIEDVIAATEKAIDVAYWEGHDPTPLERELRGLKVAQSVGEEYVTSW